MALNVGTTAHTSEFYVEVYKQGFVLGLTCSVIHFMVSGPLSKTEMWGILEVPLQWCFGILEVPLQWCFRTRFHFLIKAFLKVLPLSLVVILWWLCNRCLNEPYCLIVTAWVFYRVRYFESFHAWSLEVPVSNLVVLPVLTFYKC